MLKKKEFWVGVCVGFISYLAMHLAIAGIQYFTEEDNFDDVDDDWEDDFLTDEDFDDLGDAESDNKLSYKDTFGTEQ